MDEGDRTTTTAKAPDFSPTKQQQQKLPQGRGLIPQSRVCREPKDHHTGREQNGKYGDDNQCDRNTDIDGRENGLAAPNGNEGAGSNDDTDVVVVAKVAEFTHPGQYAFFALVSRTWRDGWKRTRRPTVTTYIALAGCSGSPNTTNATTGTVARNMASCFCRLDIEPTAAIYPPIRAERGFGS